MVSQMMQRPINTIVNCDAIWEHQDKNLKSALALGALRTLNGESESKLYENIVAIPHYSQKQAHTLVDVENETEVVAQNLEKFQDLYRPIWKE